MFSSFASLHLPDAYQQLRGRLPAGPVPDFYFLQRNTSNERKYILQNKTKRNHNTFPMRRLPFPELRIMCIV
ncbi:hypothetical protein Hanom_Chr16g01448841 [Helianthus anomalus]